MVSDNGPEVVFPPTRATSCERASAANPPVNSSSQRSSILGIVSARSAQAGRAPMAARSPSDREHADVDEAGGERGEVHALNQRVY